MGIFEIISGVLLILACAAIIFLVLIQQPKGGMGAIGGGDMMSDYRTRSADARIAKVTRYAGIALFVLTLAVSAINIFAK